MTEDDLGPLERLHGWVTLWLARAAAAILAFLAVVTFADVFARYLLNSPFSFTIEFTELGMGVIVFFGLGLVTHQDAHISVDILTSRMRRRLQALVAVTVNLAALAYLVLMVWQVWQRAADLYRLGDVTQILLLPYWPGVMLMAFGSLFMLTGVLLLLVRHLRRLAQPGD